MPVGHVFVPGAVCRSIKGRGLMGTNIWYQLGKDVSFKSLFICFCARVLTHFRNAASLLGVLTHRSTTTSHSPQGTRQDASKTRSPGMISGNLKSFNAPLEGSYGERPVFPPSSDSNLRQSVHEELGEMSFAQDRPLSFNSAERLVSRDVDEQMRGKDGKDGKLLVPNRFKMAV